MQPEFTVPESFQCFLQKARSLDLGSLAYQLMYARSGPFWTRSQAAAAIARYLGFLYLISEYPSFQLVPTPEIDQVWHHHLLDTEKYAADCQQLFGQFVHHFPYLGTGDEADRRAWYQAYALTLVLFRKHFGSDFTLSPIPADCEPLQSLAGCRSRPTVRPTVALSLNEAWLSFAARQESF
jgi:hypothetical protein